MLVEKRVALIIRWLERLKKSYSSGEMKSALMEAECAKADLENLRKDVWAKVSPDEYSHDNIFSGIMKFLRVSSLSAIIIMTAVFPLSKEINVPAPIIENDKNNLVLAQPIIIVNEIEQEHKIINENKNILPTTIITTKTQPKNNRQAQSQSRSQKKHSQINNSQPQKNSQQKIVPYDQVLSLIQTGQRALKNDNSVIKIQ